MELVVVATTLPTEGQDGLDEHIPTEERTEQVAAGVVDEVVTVPVRLVAGGAVPGSAGGVVLDGLAALELSGGAIAGVVELQERETQSGLRL